VLDCHTKQVLGYAMADHLRTALVTDALAMAARKVTIRAGVTVFHSDRGCQYTSQEFADTTDQLGLVRSLGRTGTCYDNAWAESFNGTLKNERVNRTVYPTKDHARIDISRYIELRYNQKRLHSALGYITPNEAEQNWFRDNRAAKKTQQIHCPENVGLLIAGYAGLAGFFLLEGLLRQSGSPASLKASEQDRGTTRAVVLAYAVASDLPLLRRWLPGPALPPAVAPAGLLMQAAGLALRAWSMRALGGSYTRTLRVEDGQQTVVDSGPYRWGRHPGYLGSLLTWVGFACTSSSAPVLALIAGLLGGVYRRRIVAEEQLLRCDLFGYTTYSERTKKLIPFVW